MYLGVDVLALDLMKKMLDVNPLTRITAQAALAHPFFKKYQRKEVSTQKKNDQMIDEK
jgi:serine/threonine protein kinase